jgi:hypothetical protein
LILAGLLLSIEKAPGDILGLVQSIIGLGSPEFDFDSVIASIVPLKGKSGLFFLFLRNEAKIGIEKIDNESPVRLQVAADAA